jgi:hypothetical protein
MSAQAKMLNPLEVRERQIRCMEEMICFVSLKPIPEKADKDTIKAMDAPTGGFMSAPVLVLREYVK